MTRALITFLAWVATASVLAVLYTIALEVHSMSPPAKDQSRLVPEHPPVRYCIDERGA